VPRSLTIIVPLTAAAVALALTVPSVPGFIQEARALQCPEDWDDEPRWPYRFLEPYPRNALFWLEGAHLTCKRGRQDCAFVSAEGEHRRARVDSTGLGSESERGGWLEVSPRRPLPPGRWTLVEDPEHHTHPYQEIEVVDRVDHDAPQGGTLRSVDWTSEGGMGAALVLAFDTVQDESPVRVELELLPQDGSGELYRNSRALLDLATADTLARDGKLHRDMLAASASPQAGGALWDEQGAVAMVGWNPCARTPPNLPLRGDGPVLLRARIVDAAGNATTWEEHTIQAPGRSGSERWVP